MARLYSSGFELNSLTNNVEVNGWLGTGNSISSTIKRSGKYSFRTNPSGDYGRADIYYKTQGNQGAYYIRFHLYIASVTTLTKLLQTDMKKSMGVGIWLTADRKLQLWNIEDATQIGSDSDVLETGGWYRIEMKYDDTTLSNTSVEAKIDGITFASGTADITTENIYIMLGAVTSPTTCDMYIDDIAINDDSGSYQNSWPGDGRIIHLKPLADGEVSSWESTPGPDYTCVQETTPDDASSYIYSTTLDDESLFILENPPLVMANDATINLVSVGCRYTADVAKSDPYFKLEIEKESGGTKTQGSEVEVDNTTWTTNKIPQTGNLLTYPLTTYLDPDSNAWTKDSLITARIGAIITTDDTNDARISTLWALVEYTGDASENPGKVKIDDASNFGEMSMAGRQVLRDSNGYLYVIIRDPTNYDVECWRSIDGGDTWVEQDSGDSPAGSQDFNNICSAIDSSDVIHVIYPSGANDVTTYVIFTISTLQWGTPEDAGGTPFEGFAFGSLALDSNDVPHVIATEQVTGGTNYNNRIGGSWNSTWSLVTDYGGIVDITIGADDIPQVAVIDMLNSDLELYVGDENDATSFTEKQVDADVYDTTNAGCSIQIVKLPLPFMIIIIIHGQLVG
jgi:hypothetical protein